MNWTDIAMLVFSCTAANHMGLIGKAEEVLKRKLPILNCPKCLTFWTTMFLTTSAGVNIIQSLAVSFLSSMSAVWLELGMGYMDTLYTRIYETIYSTTDTDDTNPADANNDNPEGSMSDVRKES